MLLIQVLLLVFALFAGAKIIQRFHADDIGRREFFGWILFWFLVVIVAILPDTAAIFAKIAGVGRGADLVVYLALALLFYMLLRLTIRLEKIERNLTKLTRQDTLRQVDKKNKIV